MLRMYQLAAAGLLAAGLCPAARADDGPTPPAPAPPGPSEAAPEKPAPAQAGGGQDPRDKKIEDLERKLEDALRRIEDLEKKSPAPGPPAPTTGGEAQPGGGNMPPPPGPAPAGGSATLIPNISAIGNIVFGAGDTHRVPNRGRFNFDEFELAIQDNVAPKYRYDVFLSAEKGEEWKLGMEEGYLTRTALFPGLNARLGRIRVPFGKFNPLHSHVWPFITQPSAQAALLGPDGLISDGGLVEYTLPLKGVFAQLQLGGWQTSSETEDGLGFGAGDQGAYSARLWLGKELGRDRELELGFSRYQGSGDVEPIGTGAAAVRAGSADVFGRFRKSLTGVDLTYRSYPGAYRRLLLSAELMNHNTRLPGDDRNALGGFAYLAYRWSKFYEAGLRADYTRFPYPVNSYDWGGSLFLTRYITEQTSLRLEYQYTRSPLLGTGSGIYFQILFGSGPHTHNIQ